MIKYTIHVTAKDGSEAHVTGSKAAIEVIEAALEAAGAEWNAEVECFDFGFYEETRITQATRRRS